MDKKNINLLRFIAGGLFALEAMLILTNGLSFVSALDFIACTLMAVAMFTGFYPLMMAGAGTVSLVCLIYAIQMIGHARGITLIYMFSNLFQSAAYALVLLAALRRSMAIKINLLASAVAITGFLMIGIMNGVNMNSGFMRDVWAVFSSIRTNVATIIVPILLSGIVMQTTDKKAAPAPVAVTYNVNDKLAELVDLVNSGVITQEEYVAKRREILGL